MECIMLHCKEEREIAKEKEKKEERKKERKKEKKKEKWLIEYKER